MHTHGIAAPLFYRNLKIIDIVLFIRCTQPLKGYKNVDKSNELYESVTGHSKRMNIGNNWKLQMWFEGESKHWQCKYCYLKVRINNCSKDIVTESL